MFDTSLLTVGLAFLVPLGYALIAVGGLDEGRARHAALSALAALGLAVLGYVAAGFALEFGGVGLAYTMPGLEGADLGMVRPGHDLGHRLGHGWAGRLGHDRPGGHSRRLPSGSGESSLGCHCGADSAGVPAGPDPRLGLRADRPADGRLDLPPGGQLDLGRRLAGQSRQQSRPGSRPGRRRRFRAGASVGRRRDLGRNPRIPARKPKARRPAIDAGVPLPPVHLPLLAVLGCGLLLAGGLAWTIGNPLLALSESDLPRLALNTVLAAAAGCLPPVALHLVCGGPDRSAHGGSRPGGRLGGHCRRRRRSCPPGQPWSLAARLGSSRCWSIFVVDHLLRWDDSTAALTVHGLAGALGLLAVGIFADGHAGAGWNGVGARRLSRRAGSGRHRVACGAWLPARLAGPDAGPAGRSGRPGAVSDSSPPGCSPAPLALLIRLLRTPTRTPCTHVRAAGGESGPSDPGPVARRVRQGMPS